jgi:hypothetical protein
MALHETHPGMARPPHVTSKPKPMMRGSLILERQTGNSIKILARVGGTARYGSRRVDLLRNRDLKFFWPPKSSALSLQFCGDRENQLLFPRTAHDLHSDRQALW